MAKETINPEDVKQEKVETRRVKILMIRPEQFIVFFTKGFVFHKHARIIEGVPEDAEIIGMGSNPAFPGILLVVQSQEYDPIPVTENPPMQQITIDLGRNVSAKKTAKKRKK